MGISTTIRRIAVTAGAAVLAAGVTTAVATPAQAAMGKGRVQLCSKGNYAAYLKFASGTTTLVNPGSCVSWNIPSDTTRIDVRGHYNTSSSTFYIGSVFANSSTNPGVKIVSNGTTTDPGLYWYR